MCYDIYQSIKELANTYAITLRKKVDARTIEMASDNNSHYLIYKVLGITNHEGKLIDLYQNKGRFLYKYAGSFLEEAAIQCFEYQFNQTERKVKLPNTESTRPKTIEIDCLVDNRAHEIKWRDATTDGDHITKEHTRIQVIKAAGYTPIRVMFYYPNRSQAQRIQETLKTIYHGIGGEYYYGNSAWDYIHNQTGVDLLKILEKIASEQEGFE